MQKTAIVRYFVKNSLYKCRFFKETLLILQLH